MLKVTLSALYSQSLISISTTQRNILHDQPTLSEPGGPGGSGGRKQGGWGGSGDGWQPEDGNPFDDPDWVLSMLCVAAVPAAFELVQRCLHLNGTEVHGFVHYKVRLPQARSWVLSAFAMCLFLHFFPVF